MISAQIVAHSSCPKGHELISVLATFPRIILAEVNTHRMLSKNTASSRAIPFEKMVQAVRDNPFIPIAFQKDHKGMQGSEYFTEPSNNHPKWSWLNARDNAVIQAERLNKLGTTKQLANRLLEPFMWTTMLITGPKEDGGWDNFFNLRCPIYNDNDYNITFKSWKDLVKDSMKRGGNRDVVDGLENYTTLERLKINKGAAEIHMMQLAECIWDAINESTPKQLKEGEWHIPFESKIDNGSLESFLDLKDATWSWVYDSQYEDIDEAIKLDPTLIESTKVMISTAMAAQTSYTVIGNERTVNNYIKSIELHDRLVKQNPPHSSPMEHCARVMDNHEYISNIKGIIGCSEDEYDISLPDETKGWCRNFRGFIPYRHIIETKS